jgi:hypothetical protein
MGILTHRPIAAVLALVLASTAPQALAAAALGKAASSAVAT